MGREWSDHELERLREHGPQGTSKDLVRLFPGRTAKAINNTRIKHGIPAPGRDHPSRLKHGQSKRNESDATPTYMSWNGMITRCYRKAHHNYERYGGRGIKVCDRWRHSFGAFLEDMGARPTGLTLNRTDNDGDYEPGNCEWADAVEQATNRESTCLITVDGVVLSIAEWARRKGLKETTLARRLKHGWLPEEAIKTPLSPRTIDTGCPTCGVAAGAVCRSMRTGSEMGKYHQTRRDQAKRGSTLTPPDEVNQGLRQPLAALGDRG